MSEASELLESGDFIEYGELCERVAGVLHTNVNTVKEWLISPLTKIRSMLCFREMIVLPDDRVWKTLYRAELVYPMVGYLRWHRFGDRRSVVAVVCFFNSFLAGDEKALAFLPPAAYKKYQSMIKEASDNTPAAPSQNVTQLFRSKGTAAG